MAKKLKLSYYLRKLEETMSVEHLVAAFPKLKRARPRRCRNRVCASRAAVRHKLQTDAKNRTAFEPST